MAIDLPKALDAIPVVQNGTDRDARFPTPSTNQRVFRLDTSNVELYNGASWGIVIVGQNVTEGSWTPAMVGATTAGTFTYGTQNGRYTKVGNLVTAWGYMTTSAVSVNAAGALTITGLPSVASSLGSFASVAIGEVSGITLGSGLTQVVGYLPPGGSAIVLHKAGSAAASVALAGADLSSSWGIMFSLTYRSV